MSAVPSALRAESPWKPALAALLSLIALVLFLYRDTAATMVAIWWRSDTFKHGFFVLPLSLWLIWRLREDLARLTPRPWPWALLAMAVVALFWFVSDLVVVGAATQFALVGLLALTVPAVLGVEVARTILFPLLFLFFSVPFGEFMLPPMMDWTADFVIKALQLTGVPVYREGLHFVIPSGNWSVIDECSGVRYLIASFMVGSLFAYLNYNSYRRRALFILASILVPIVANWLRAYLIVMLGHLSGNKLAVGVDHILYGWVFFGIVIFFMFRVGARWSEPEEHGRAAGAQDAALVARSTQGFSPLIALPLVAAVLAAPHLGYGALRLWEGTPVQPVLVLPDSLPGGWKTEGAVPPRWNGPNYSNPSAEVSRGFTGPAGTVGVYIAYYRGQDLDRKLVSSVNGVVAINDRVWNRVAAGVANVQVGATEASFLTSEILGPTSAAVSRRPQVVVWNAYWIDGRWIISDARAKLAGAFARLRGRGDEGAAIVLSADEGSAEKSAALLRTFTQAHLPAIEELLRRTHAAR